MKYMNSSDGSFLCWQVSHDCSVLFVDGSESGRGSICVELEFSLGMFSGSLCLAVWAPVVPLRVSLSDSVLSPINGWNYYSESGYAIFGYALQKGPISLHY